MSGYPAATLSSTEVWALRCRTHVGLEARVVEVTFEAQGMSTVTVRAALS